MIIDTHCHLDDESYFDDLHDVIERAKLGGVGSVVIPGADIKDLGRAQMIAHSYDDVYFTVGVHPYHKDDFDLNRLKEFAKDPKCVAVGECGLDYFRLKKDFATLSEREEEMRAQKEVFEAQIRLAVLLKKPLILHIRDANEDSYTILSRYAPDLVGANLHCYNASRLLLEFKKFGFYFGIGGVLTFKNAKSLVDILPDIGIDHIVLETDGPYLTPEPFRGRRNEPLYTKYVSEKIAKLLEINITEVEDITTKNAKRLFRI